MFLGARRLADPVQVAAMPPDLPVHLRLTVTDILRRPGRHPTRAHRAGSGQWQVTGRGVGTGLLAEAKRWAAAHGVHRLELTVMAHNHRAIGLYERMGFSVEGRRA